MRTGAIELRLGRTEMRTGAIHLRLLPIQMCSGAIELRLPPIKMGTSAIKLRLSSIEMCSAAIDLRLGQIEMGFGVRIVESASVSARRPRMFSRHSTTGKLTMNSKINVPARSISTSQD